MNAFEDNHSLFFRAFVYVTLIAFTAGCTSMRTISTADSRNIAGQLEIGETVKVIRKNGDTLRFKVEQMSRSGITGQGHAIAFDDMQELRVSQSTESGDNKYVLWILLGLIGVLFATGVLEGQEIQGY